MIYLVGFMASGKTFWGKKLADVLQFQFLDLDEQLEKQYKMSISEMFEQWGEDEFRKIESQTLQSISGDKIVLATGGGSPFFYDGMDYLLMHGTVIYLNTSLELVSQRIEEEQKKRPLMSKFNKDELHSEISKLYGERHKIYAKAHITVDTANSTIEEVINMLNS